MFLWKRGPETELGRSLFRCTQKSRRERSQTSSNSVAFHWPNSLSSCSGVLNPLGIFVEPVEVGFGAGYDEEGDEFGDFVAVEASNFPFESAEAPGSGFD